MISNVQNTLQRSTICEEFAGTIQMETKCPVKKGREVQATVKVEPQESDNEQIKTEAIEEATSTDEKTSNEAISSQAAEDPSEDPNQAFIEVDEDKENETPGNIFIFQITWTKVIIS